MMTRVSSTVISSRRLLGIFLARAGSLCLPSVAAYAAQPGEEGLP